MNIKKPQSKLHQWLLNAHPLERETVARKANVKLHYIDRLARCAVPNPSLFMCRRIIKAIQEHNILQLDDRLPNVTLDDIKPRGE